MIRRAIVVALAAALLASAGAEAPAGDDASLLVEVRGPDGRPVDAGEVRLFAVPLAEGFVRHRIGGRFVPPEEMPDAVRAASIDGGVATFTDLEAGRYRAVAFAPGRARAEAETARAPGLPAARLRLDLAPTAGIEGRVLLQDTRPEPGVRVLVALPGTRYGPCSPTETFRAVSDAEGRYHVEGLAPGVYETWTRRPGGPWVRGDTLRSPAVDRLDLRVTDGAIVTGVVTARATGAPVAGARLEIHGWPHHDEHVLGRGVTGEDGRYRIRTDRRHLNGERLHVFAPGLALRRIESDLLSNLHEGDVKEIDVALEPGSAVTGIVTGPDGPVAGARVSAWFPVGRHDDLARVSARTDAEGRYRVGGLAAGPHWVEVQAPGFDHGAWGRPVWTGRRDEDEAPEAARIELDAGEEAGFDVRLVAAGTRPEDVTVTGVVRDVEGDPVPLAVVVPTNGEPVLTGPDGTFRVRGRTTRDWNAIEVRAFRRGWDSGSATAFPDRPETRTGAEIVLRRMPVLRGRVVSEIGRPVAGADIVIGNRAWARNMGEVTDWDFVAGARAGADGSFALPFPTFEDVEWAGGSFGGGPLNGFVVGVRAPGHGPAISAPFRAEPRRREYRVEVRAGAGCGISGRVLSAETGDPLPGVPIRLERPGDGSAWLPDRLPAPWQIVAALTDAAGEFRIADLAAGRYVLDVEVPGSLGERVEVEAPAAGPVEIRPGPGRPLAGVVTRPDGSPVPSARVWLADDEEGDDVYTDTFGRFRFDSVRSGPRVVCARTPREPLGQGLSEPVEAGAGEVRIVLPAGLEIAGLVTDTRGEPREGIRVVARSREPGVEEVEEETGGDGRYVLTGLRPGLWNLEFRTRELVAGVPGVPAGADRDLRIGGDLVLSGRVRPRELAVLTDLRRSATLEAVPAEPPARAGFSVRYLARLDPEEGTFEFRGLPPGEYRLAGRFRARFLGEERTFRIRGTPLAPAGATNVELRLSFQN